MDRPAHPDVAYAGFDLQVVTDRVVYAPGQTVRLSVSATNHGDRFVEHHYPGWQRYVVTIHDEQHRVVADDELDRSASSPAVDRWLPGQHAIWPTYWTQAAGPLVPAWIPDVPPGPPVPPGRYRARVRWLGREPQVRERPAEVWGSWFELT